MTSMFGPYRLEALLGRGGMGEIYRAVDTRKGRVVALKVLGSWLADDADFRKRFQREAELAARLNDPHVVPIHDYGEIDGQLYIDMRLVEGCDLARAILDSGPLSPADAVGIVTQVASALDSAHAEQLIHRDVKPSNILLVNGRIESGSAFAYLADFGIVRLEGGTASASSSVIGSFAYMAPERFSGDSGGLAVDVYALAAVLHEALTGQAPFPHQEMVRLMHAHLYSPVPVPSALQSGLSRGLDAVVARGMAKDPVHRFPSAGALAIEARAALRPAAVTVRSGNPSTARTVAPTYVPGRRAQNFGTVSPANGGDFSPNVVPRRRRGRTLAIGLVAAAVAIVAVGITFFETGDFESGQSESAQPASRGSASSTVLGMPEPEVAAPSNGVTEIGGIFGPSCDQFPVTGEGSAAGMIDDPVATAVSNNPLLSTFTTAVGAVPGLADTLDSASALTVLAPYNGAFEALPAGTVETLVASPDQLTPILFGHVSSTRYDAEGLVAAGSIDVLSGGSVTIGGAADAPTFNGGNGTAATNLCGNVPTANATVFVIDSVLTPAS